MDAVGDEGAPTRTNIIQKGAAVTAGQKGAAVTEDFYLKRQTQRKLVPLATKFVPCGPISDTVLTESLFKTDSEGVPKWAKRVIFWSKGSSSD